MEGKVCIVDHDPTSRTFIQECLQKEGLDVFLFDTGFQIRPVLSRETFNVFILDIAAPGVRDKNFLIELRKFPTSKILLIVSERGNSFLKEAIDLGVYGFLYKPFNPAEICTMVSHLIR